MAMENFVNPEFVTMYQREVPLLLKLLEFSYNSMWNRWNET